MGHLIISLALISPLTFPTAEGQVNAGKVPLRVGQIFIVGNEITRQDVILQAIGLYPGQVLLAADVRAAERNLAKLGIFQVDPKTGIRPTVQVLPPREDDSEYRDLLVTVQEMPTSSLRCEIGADFTGEPILRLVLEERNFDLLRLPTSWDDLLSGRAFRGAGQKFRLEVIRIHVATGRVGCLRLLAVPGEPVFDVSAWLNPR